MGIGTGLGILTLATFLIAWLFLAILTGAFATWRLAAYIYTDKGIFGKMQEAREKIADQGGWLCDQVSCFWCISLWVGLIIWPISLIAWPILLPIAFSGAAILLSHGGRTIWRYTDAGNNG